MKGQASRLSRAAKRRIERDVVAAMPRSIKKANTRVLRDTAKLLGVPFQRRKGVGIVHGLGDYTWDDNGKTAHHIPGTATDSVIGRLARSLGGSLGGHSWSNVGGTVGNWFSSILGFGDYEVNSNTVLNGLNGDPVPVMHSDNDSVIIRHREFIGDVQSATNFTNTAYAINPGNNKLFPWLAPIAANFRMWRLRGCLMEFKSTSAQALAAANPAMGVIMMSTNYNVYDPPFLSKVMIDNNVFTTSGRPMDTFVHPIECAPAQSPVKWYYMRTGDVPSGQDARLYDMGLFQIAAVGSQSVATVGEFWMTYEIELAKPILYGGLGVDTPLYLAHASYTGSADFSIATPKTTTPGVVVDSNSLGIAFDTGTAKCVLPPGMQGYYSIAMHVRSSVSISKTSGWGSTGLALANVYPSTSTVFGSSFFESATGAEFGMIMTFRITDPSVGATITIPVLHPASSSTHHVEIMCEQLPYNLGAIAEGKSILTHPFMNKYGGKNPLKCDELSKATQLDILNRLSRSYMQHALSDEKYDDENYQLLLSYEKQHNIELQQSIEENKDEKEGAVELQEIITCPRPTVGAITQGLRALGLSKSTLDIPALKRQ